MEVHEKKEDDQGNCLDKQQFCYDVENFLSGLNNTCDSH